MDGDDFEWEDGPAEAEAGADPLALQWEQAEEQAQQEALEAGGTPDTDQEGGEGWEDGVLTFSLEGGGGREGRERGEGEGADQPRRRPVRRATTEDKEWARMVHRAHLLCLLGRALALDEACGSELLQAAMLSVLPFPLQRSSGRWGGGTMDGDEADEDSLLQLAAWFRKTFTLHPAGVPRECSPVSAEALLAALERRGGTGEEMAALSVSLLRALGIASRLVSVLDPLPLKPDASLLEGIAPSSPAEPSRKNGWGRNNAAGGGNIDRSRAGRMRANEVIALAGGAGPAGVPRKREEPLVVSGRGSRGKADARSNGGLGLVMQRQRGQGRERNVSRLEDGEGEETVVAGVAVEEGNVSEMSETDGKGNRGKGRGGRRGKVESASDGRSGQDNAQDDPNTEEVGGKRTGGRKNPGQTRGAGKKGTEKESNTGSGIADLSASVEVRPAPEDPSDKGKRRRRGDEEFELQLAMALTATAEAQGGEETGRRPTGGVKDQAGMGVLVVNRAGKRKASSGAGAVWSKGYGEVTHWAEVYCVEPEGKHVSRSGPSRLGPSDGGVGPAGMVGRWLHLDAVRGVVDGGAKVEGLAAGLRHGGLRYVVALSGGGGAKDVTRKYVALWSKVVGLRDEEWWEETMAPFRRRLEGGGGEAEEGRGGRVGESADSKRARDAEEGRIQQPVENAGRPEGVEDKMKEDSLLPQGKALQECQVALKGEHSTRAAEIKVEVTDCVTVSTIGHDAGATLASDVGFKAPVQGQTDGGRKTPHVLSNGHKSGQAQSLDGAAGAQPASGNAARPCSNSASRTAGKIKAQERSSLEDMEMDIKALTEPLPTSQQAYRAHPLYALERWLGRYECLHPRGPVLGLCAGQPVFPRACVRQLHSRGRWLCKGRSVREGERPAKVCSSGGKEGEMGKGRKRGKGKGKEEGGRGSEGPLEEEGEEEFEAMEPPRTSNEEVGTRGPNGGVHELELFGEWQTEECVPPSAVDGRVPKNRWGQVDVFSSAMLPRGTVHLTAPGVVRTVQRLGLDFAPAVVGFEARGGRTVPKYEGVVVCVEHQDAVLAACAEEERAREAVRVRRRKDAALHRWRDLLQTVVLRRELRDKYEGGQPLGAPSDSQDGAGEDAEGALGQSELQETEAAPKGPSARDVIRQVMGPSSSAKLSS